MNAWSKPLDAILAELEVSPDRGLSEEDAQARLSTFGKNQLRQKEKERAVLIFARQFRSLVVALLAVAAALSLAFGDWVEALAILFVILANAVIGFVTEMKAVRSMEALSHLDLRSARVRRDGVAVEIPAPDLVPGDIVLVEGGDVVTADMRLVEASKLQADESTLTGESYPVAKYEAVLAPDVSFAERANMLFKGTAVTRGSAEAVVVATGMNTELGRISSLVEEATTEQTPLERQLDALGRKLIYACLGIVALMGSSGAVLGKPPLLMLQTAIALAVAAIPEGLPIVATLALARGMVRMARRNALVQRLSAVETLGAVNVLCVDKTGTLTENRMTARLLIHAGGEIPLDGSEPLDGKGREARTLEEALTIGALCNNAELADGDGAPVGEPLEVGLLQAARLAGVERRSLLSRFPEVREEAFDPETKMMATFHRAKDGDGDGDFLVAVKGAPEAVLRVCTAVRIEDGERPLDPGSRERWLASADAAASRGLRLLALAHKRAGDAGVSPYEDLTLVAIVGFMDPPRRDVKDTIEHCRRAGVRVVMVTGDQPLTARAIGAAVGMGREEGLIVLPGSEIDHRREGGPDPEVSIYARVSPRQKLELVRRLQRQGATVAMTGDGVNDAPALEQADIGIAMGGRGTQVAREAADMVLRDDSLATIVAAISEGRVIFGNLRNFVFYLLSCNVSEILIVGIASLAGAPLPLLPLQILFLNLVTDVFPALALGAGPGAPDVLAEPPRPSSEPIVTRAMWRSILGYGAMITATVLGAFFFALEGSNRRAVTVAFLSLALSQLWHVLNVRAPSSKLFDNEVTRNPFVLGALLLCLGLLAVAVYLPPFAEVLSLVEPSAREWGLILGASALPLVGGQVQKSVAAFRARRKLLASRQLPTRAAPDRS